MRYPTVETDTAVVWTELLARVQHLFSQCGMAEADASLLADSLVRADLRGVHSHGVLRVPEYVEKLRHGGVDPRAKPELTREFGAISVIDGCNAMGQIACAFAMVDALDRAQRYGIGAAAIHGSNHCGA